MRLENKKTRLQLSGYTLVELLLVMAVLGTLISVTLSLFPGYTSKARDTERVSDLKQYQNALEVYANRNNGLYINTSQDMDAVCTSASLNTATCPQDPQGNSYQYVGSTTSYFAYIELEQPEGGSTKYYVVCSNGRSGSTTSDPSTAASCPL